MSEDALQTTFQRQERARGLQNRGGARRWLSFKKSLRRPRVNRQVLRRVSEYGGGGLNSSSKVFAA